MPAGTAPLTKEVVGIRAEGIIIHVIGIIKYMQKLLLIAKSDANGNDHMSRQHIKTN